MPKTDRSGPAGSAWGEQRTAFLALRDVIRREVETGQPLIAAFVASGANKAMSYSSFARYVGRYLAEDSAIQRYAKRPVNAAASQPAGAEGPNLAAPPAPPPAPPVPAVPPVPFDPASLVPTPKDTLHEPKRGPLPVVRRFRPHQGPVKDSDVW